MNSNDVLTLQPLLLYRRRLDRIEPQSKCPEDPAEEGKPDAQIAIRSARALGKRVVDTTLIIREGLTRNESLLAAEPLYLSIFKKIREKGSLRRPAEK